MKQTSFLWQAAGFALTTLGGTFLHLLYDWTGGSILASPFSAVNESTCEHMKLLFWPLFLFALVQRLFFKDQKIYWCVKLAQLLLGLVLIPVLFYTYNGIFGPSSHWANIAIFYLCSAFAFLFEWWAIRSERLPCRHPGLALGAILLIGVLFSAYTFLPPRIPLFQDPITGLYGIA